MSDNDNQDKRSLLRSKCMLGVVFAKEELRKEFPGTAELLEAIVERLNRLETGEFPPQEEPTKPQRRTPAYGLDMSEVLPKTTLPKPVPPELRSASSSFKKVTDELRETLMQSGKRTQEISEDEMAEILRGRKDP